MKLSEAIRLGAMLRPQGYGGGPGTSCALMAALEAIGKPAGYVCWMQAVEQWPWLGAKYQHPVNGANWAGDEIVIDLNDHERWPRGRIADWVETIEATIEQRTEQPEAIHEPD